MEIVVRATPSSRFDLRLERAAMMGFAWGELDRKTFLRMETNDSSLDFAARTGMVDGFLYSISVVWVA